MTLPAFRSIGSNQIIGGYTSTFSIALIASFFFLRNGFLWSFFCRTQFFVRTTIGALK